VGITTYVECYDTCTATIARARHLPSLT
jgi:hypothetical protein